MGKEEIDPRLQGFLMAAPGSEEEYEWLRLSRNILCPEIEAMLGRKFGVFFRVCDVRDSGRPKVVRTEREEAREVAAKVLNDVYRAIASCKAEPDMKPILNIVGLTRKRTNDRFADYIYGKRREFFIVREEMLALAKKRHASLFALWTESSARKNKAFGLLVWRLKAVASKANQQNWDLFFSVTDDAIAVMLRENKRELEKAGVQDTGAWVRGSAWHYYLLLTWLGDKVPVIETAKCLCQSVAYRSPISSQDIRAPKSPRIFREDLGNLAKEYGLVSGMNLEHRRSYLLSHSNHGVCPLKLYLAGGIIDHARAVELIGATEDFLDDMPCFLPNLEIARLFDINHATVHVYRHRIRKRLEGARGN